MPSRKKEDRSQLKAEAKSNAVERREREREREKKITESDLWDVSVASSIGFSFVYLQELLRELVTGTLSCLSRPDS